MNEQNNYQQPVEQNFQQPAPQYQQPAPQYQQPAPQYQQSYGPVRQLNTHRGLIKLILLTIITFWEALSLSDRLFICTSSQERLCFLQKIIISEAEPIHIYIFNAGLRNIIQTAKEGADISSTCTSGKKCLVCGEDQRAVGRNSFGGENLDGFQAFNGHRILTTMCLGSSA